MYYEYFFFNVFWGKYYNCWWFLVFVIDWEIGDNFSWFNCDILLGVYLYCLKDNYYVIILRDFCFEVGGGLGDSRISWFNFGISEYSRVIYC